MSMCISSARQELQDAVALRDTMLQLVAESTSDTYEEAQTLYEKADQSVLNLRTLLDSLNSLKREFSDRVVTHIRETADSSSSEEDAFSIESDPEERLASPKEIDGSSLSEHSLPPLDEFNVSEGLRVARISASHKITYGTIAELTHNLFNNKPMLHIYIKWDAGDSSGDCIQTGCNIPFTYYVS